MQTIILALELCLNVSDGKTLVALHIGILALELMISPLRIGLIMSFQH